MTSTTMRVPGDLKGALDRAFEGEDKDAIIADTSAPGTLDISRRDWWNIGGILLAALLMRVWFLHPSVYFGDAVEFVRGALWTVAAHPPGYVGFCMLARLLNYIVGNIQWSFVIISLVNSFPDRRPQIN